MPVQAEVSVDTSSPNLDRIRRKVEMMFSLNFLPESYTIEWKDADDESHDD